MWILIVLLIVVGCGSPTIAPLTESDEYQALSVEQQNLVRLYAEHQSVKEAEAWLVAGGNGPLILTPPNLIDVLDKEATAVFESLHKPLQDAMLVVWQERFKREIVSKYVRRGSVLPALVRQYSHPIAPAELEHYPKSYVDCAAQVWNRVVKAIPPHMRSVDAYLDEREQATLDRLAKTPSGGLIRVYSDTGFGRLFWELVADDILVLQLSVTACYTVPFEEEMAETLRENARRYLAEIVYKREGRSK